jgi:hypothetical protein
LAPLAARDQRLAVRLLDAVMGPPQVAGFGKRWLSLTVMV